MRTDEAIKNLEFHIRLGELVHHKDDITAIKLGIEALKRHKWNKTHDYPKVYSLLPGETEEKGERKTQAQQKNKERL